MFRISILQQTFLHIRNLRTTVQRYISLMMLVTLFLVGLILPSTTRILAVEAPNSGLNNTDNLVEQGRLLYKTGQFDNAIEVLQQAAKNYAYSKDKLRQAMTLRNLSLAQQELGLWTEAEDAIAKSFKLLENLENSRERSQIFAQTLDAQGQWQLKRGQTEAAIQTWQQAADIYSQIGEEVKFIRNRINSAQALQTLGLYLQAQKILTDVQQKLQGQAKSLLKATALHHLGNVLQAIGDMDRSTQLLHQSLKIALSLQANQQIAGTLISLANTAHIRGNTQKALTFYEQALDISVPTNTKVQILLNKFSLLLETKKWQIASALSPKIQSEISKLSPSRMKIYAQINFAHNLVKLKQKNIADSPSWLDIAKIISEAIEQGQSLEDKRAESYATGTLGWLYLQTKQFSNAENLTKKALWLAESIQASDISYQWQWQLGRLLKQRGDIKEALAFYNAAYNNLQLLRSDLVAIDSDIQFSFRKDVEPVYREFVDVLLKMGEYANAFLENKSITDKESINQNYLQQARSIVESLQLAELNNYFRSACLKPRQKIDQIVEEKDQQAAFIYPIILPDRLEIILKLPNQKKLLRYKVIVDKEKLETVATDLRKYLLDVTATIQVQQQSQQIYDWLIKPIETDLTNNKIKTLVFVLDGVLRNIPMSVLYDQQQQKYLIEKYAVVLASGLQLVEPQPLRNIKLNTLIAGIGEERQFGNHNFPALKNVARELQIIESQVRKSQQIFNQAFTVKNLQKQLQSKSFRVVHLATHGNFSSNFDETFILTWDRLLKAKDFNSLVKSTDSKITNSIELLVLSACETAMGDEEAVLGLAGLAVEAGARSTLATLWSVDDKSVAECMNLFYLKINAGLPKSEALREAQLGIMKNEKRPYFWSPYVLLGNWL